MNASISEPRTLREGLRNRLLRRADWRFLLPEVNPNKAISFAKGSIEDATRYVSSAFADGSISDGGANNSLAVAVDPGEETIREAFASLKPGGSFYAEWRSRRSRGLDSIRQKLTDVGFRNLSLYWPRPDPEISPASIWLPLDEAEGLRYYFDNRPPARNLARSIARGIRRAMFWPQPRFKLATPVSSIATRPSPSIGKTGPEVSQSRSSPGILEGVRDRWVDWGLGSPPDRLSMLLITRGLRASGKIVALVFANGEARPVLAIKMPRVPESVLVLQREVSVLDALRNHLPIRDSVPRVLSAGETRGVYQVVETAVDGLPAYGLVTHENFRAIALAAAEWLARLAGHPEPQPRAQWWPRLVEPLLTEFQEHFGPVVSQDLLRDCRHALDSLGSLPIVWEQRDFSPWNVFIDRAGSIAAVDWESAEPEGLPLLDLVYFLTYLSFSVDQAKRTGRFLESYQSSRDPDSFAGRVAMESMDRYSTALGIDRDLYQPLRILTWLLHSRSEYAELVADAGDRPSAKALERSLFLRLWMEDVRFGR